MKNFKFDVNKLIFIGCIMLIGTIFYLFWQPLTKVLSDIFKVCKPLIYAGAIAYVLWPIEQKFENVIFKNLNKDGKNAKRSRIISIIVTYIIFISLLVLLFGMVIPQILESLSVLQTRLKDYYLIIEKWTNMLPNIEMFADFQADVQKIISKAIEAIYTFLNSSINVVTSTALNVVILVKNLALGIVFSIYFIIYKENLFAQLKKLTFSLINASHYEKLMYYVEITDQSFGGFIKGKSVDSLLVGMICFIFMTLTGMAYPLLISVIIGITNMIPFFGPFIGAIPTGFIMAIVQPNMFLWFLLLIFLLQQLDGNIIGPFILGEFTGLNALWVIIAITVMGGLFGFVGMFLGIPIFSVIYRVIKESAEMRLANNGLETSTKEYYQNKQYQSIVYKDKQKHLPTHK